MSRLVLTVDSRTHSMAINAAVDGYTDQPVTETPVEDVSATETQKHPFHVLTDSKLPIFIASAAGALALTFVYKLHSADSLLEEILALKFLVSAFFVAGPVQFVSTNLMILFFIVILIALMLSWTYRLLDESNSNHTRAVQTDIKHGMLLFLVSEAMLFFPFFWAFFHAALSPSVMIGGV
jgi:cytochrome c oxidase subunit 3